MIKSEGIVEHSGNEFCGTLEETMPETIRVCPSCHSSRLKRYDIYRYGGRTRRRYRCENCEHITAYPLIQVVPERRGRKKK